MTDLPTQPVRACPQCQAGMNHLVLPTHGGPPVVVDHCAACRWVWFDALESVQLTGAGWVSLLRELQRGHRGGPVATGAAAASCPVCRQALKPVHNLTRYGRFPVRECPQRHGHLHSHVGLLAERGLVRPMLGPELRALAEERRTLHCLHCGARADGQSSSCGYCDAPLVVFDLPRLTHALLRRPMDDSPAPAPDGLPMGWSCHGCGAALDPTREVACPQCGHAVVAPSLAALAPVLAAAEHRWQEAAKAARPYRRKPPRRQDSWRETTMARLLHQLQAILRR